MKYGEAIKSHDVEVLDRIDAMLSREETSVRCHDYLTLIVNASCRRAMVDWCFIVCDSFGLGRETVGIAMSILDRYLSSGKGKSSEALQSRQRFQLASITSFFMAVKVNEPAQLGIDLLVKLCRGYYEESAILELEREILSSLDWRVCLSATTPMDYVRHFLELLPERAGIAGVVEENAMAHMERATSDIYFSTCRASAIGLACLAGALRDTLSLTPSEEEELWRELSGKLEFDIASDEIRLVERQLLGGATSREPRRKSRATLARPSDGESADKQSSSPVSIMRVCPGLSGLFR